MVDQGLRARAQRLLKGDLRADDLTRLFLYARDRCDGREPVQEIGDFVAHKDERTKGLITRETLDWAVTARFRVEVTGAPPLNPARLPQYFPEYIAAMSRRLDHKTIKDETGITRAEAGKLSTAIIRKMVCNADKTWGLNIASCSQRERAILNCYCNWFVVKPAFDGTRLFQDFAATLKSHGLIHKSEMRDFDRARSPTILYAVTAMHNCVVVLPDGTRIMLAASRALQIGVAAPIPVNHQGKDFKISTDMFITDLLTADVCTQELLAAAVWDFDLELTPEGKLGRLG